VAVTISAPFSAAIAARARSIHACPGFEMGFGILLGVTYGVVDHQAKAGS
jgi:hypothetical protein